MERKRLGEPVQAGSDYFPSASLANIRFIPSGCTVLDCVLGGGWPLGRIVNIVGDKAVGKTLLAIEAAANFVEVYPDGHIWYREAEAAFDEQYAGQLGLPLDRVDFGPHGIGSGWDTIEDIFEDLESCVKTAYEAEVPGLYIIDSLDALSSRAELSRKLDEGTYNLEKPKQLGQLFRRLTRGVKKSAVCVIFISQVRDRIGVVFGDRHTRSGGRAMDFYASQIVYLSHLAILGRTIKGVKRATGVRVRAKTKKNKISTPFRDCEFAIKFGYGMDDIEASLAWLKEVKMLGRAGVTDKEMKKFIADAADLPLKERLAKTQHVSRVVREVWAEIEAQFMPPTRKY